MKKWEHSQRWFIQEMTKHGADESFIIFQLEQIHGTVEESWCNQVFCSLAGCLWHFTADVKKRSSVGVFHPSLSNHEENISYIAVIFFKKAEGLLPLIWTTVILSPLSSTSSFIQQAMTHHGVYRSGNNGGKLWSQTLKRMDCSTPHVLKEHCRLSPQYCNIPLWLVSPMEVCSAGTSRCLFGPVIKAVKHEYFWPPTNEILPTGGGHAGVLWVEVCSQQQAAITFLTYLVCHPQKTLQVFDVKFMCVCACLCVCS